MEVLCLPKSAVKFDVDHVMVFDSGHTEPAMFLLLHGLYTLFSDHSIVLCEWTAMRN